MRKTTLAVAALAALGGLAASTAPASAWHRHWHRTTVVVRPGYPVVAPVYPFIAPVVVVKTCVFTVGRWMMFSPMKRFGIMKPFG